MTTHEKAAKLYRKVNTFILTCIDGEGYPLTKAVVPGKYREKLSEMFFCTNTSSKFASAIANNGKSSVYFYTRKLVWKGCMLSGYMEIIDDISIKEKYWQNKFKNAYPQKSYTDPEFCLLRFVPSHGRFYSCFKPENFDINK